MQIRSPYAFAAGIGGYILGTLLLVFLMPEEAHWTVVVVAGMYHALLFTAIVHVARKRLEKPPVWSYILVIATTVSALLIGIVTDIEQTMYGIFFIGFIPAFLKEITDLAGIVSIGFVTAFIGWNYLEYFRTEQDKIALKRFLLWVVLGTILLGMTACTALFGGGSF